MDPLDCGQIVYRAIPRKKWIDPVTNTILPDAFFLRPAPKDADGLSIDIVSPSSCASVLASCYGVVSLHVGRVRTLMLDVVSDEPPHGNIVGLPRREDDKGRAEFLASQLARQARIVPPADYQ